ncbi:unnamed protein product [Euphydryas editha]|uniref:DUF4795 domain-containing protein n=1 Tax=Euphydryas editha TaxID=104508 RepID=A0AAU9VAH0_EUPED|nr:unnamed protein product [Euphydryas editha]
MSNSSIMTVREMIDSAFGEPNENVVNLKLVQTILIILARQLRILERKVGIEIGPSLIRSTSSIFIREVKLLAKKNKKALKDTDLANNNNKGVPTVKVPLVGTPTNKHHQHTTVQPTSSSSDKSSEGTKSKSTADKTSTSGPSSSLKTSTALTSSDKTTDEATTEDYKRKRADSREEAERAPTPMKSLDSIEMQFEKLLIVERVSTEDVKAQTGRSRDSKGLQLSIVTKEQFDNLAQIVKELQEKFSSAGKPEFPENIQLMQDLRKGASLTDAMAALQLSARLDAAEATLQQMMTLVTDLATRKGIEITEVQEVSQKSTTPKSRKKIPKSEKNTSQGIVTQGISTDVIKIQSIDASDSEIVDNVVEEPSLEIMDISKIKPDMINFSEMDQAIQEVYDILIKSVKNITNKIASNAENALKIAHKLEEKLNNTSSLDNRMNNLEALVSEYTEQINVLDTGLSSQMTNYQEQLTQMQHDLEAGLESMTEALANTGGDTAAVTELNLNFTNLQVDFDATNMRQKELKENQEVLSSNLQDLWKQIELLRGTKSDRDEVADALRDKAGLGALNGLVTQQQFDAVRGDFEKRIGASYDKFNNQEIIWQKAIDDLLRELHEKADLMQVASLRDDINCNLEKLRNRINAMMDIVGEPKSAAISKKLFRDTACLSCSSPAHMDIEEPNTIPSLPVLPNTLLPSSVKANNIMAPKEDGDHGLCYPGKPIPHVKDPRSHYCRRYCGGSHTVLSTTVKRAPSEMIISSALRNITTGPGSNEKTNDPDLNTKPCIPCNLQNLQAAQPNQATKEDRSVHPREELESDVIELDFFAKTSSLVKNDGESISRTPPPPSDDD